MHLFDRFLEIGDAAALQYVSGSPRLKRRDGIVNTRDGGEGQNLRLGTARRDLLDGVKHIPRHVQVHQHDVGRVLLAKRQGATRIAPSPDNPEIWL